MYEIYGADWCNYCTKAKTLVGEKGFTVKVYDVDEDGVAEGLASRLPSPKRTIPQIFKDGEYIGGYDDLIKSLKIN